MTLGPQTAELHAVAEAAEKLLRGHGPEALEFAAAVDAHWPAIEAAEERAIRALEADGIDSMAVYDLGACVWGHLALALAARHLIGTGEWTQDAYDALAHSWRISIGPLHPDDG